MPGLLDRRLIYVTGKGGVGKSTAAVTLGMLAARHGRRTIVAEVSSQDRVRRSLGADGETFEELRVGDDLYTISIDPERAMEEYLRVKTGPLGQALGASRLFQAFAMATPGMRELLTMGKVWELAQTQRRTGGADAYDLVIVDAPASGHGIGLLRTPRTFAEIARVGPVANLAQRISATLADPSFTAVVAVCTAEEMPVNETLWLAQALSDDGTALSAVLVNALYAPRFSVAERKRLSGAQRRAGDGPVGAALRAAVSEHDRVVAQREQLARLREGLQAAHAERDAEAEADADADAERDGDTDAGLIFELPYVFADAIEPAQLQLLADVLEQALAGR